MKGQLRLHICTGLSEFMLLANMVNNKNLMSLLKSFLAYGDFSCLLITFANSLDPDQDRQNVGPDLDPNYLTL